MGETGRPAGRATPVFGHEDRYIRVATEMAWGSVKGLACEILQHLVAAECIASTVRPDIRFSECLPR